MVCEGCPLLSALEAGTQAIKTSETHTEKDKATGYINLTRILLNQVAEKTKCEGLQINEHGQQICPLEATVNNARQLVVAKLNPASLVLDPSEFNPTNHVIDKPVPGQYL
jgi:hypothetical protein